MIKVVTKPRARWKPGRMRESARAMRLARRHYQRPAPDAFQLYNVLVVNNETLRVEARRGVPWGLPLDRAMNVARVVEQEIDPNRQHVLVIHFETP